MLWEKLLYVRNTHWHQISHQIFRTQEVMSFYVQAVTRDHNYCFYSSLFCKNNFDQVTVLLSAPVLISRPLAFVTFFCDVPTFCYCYIKPVPLGLTGQSRGRGEQINRAWPLCCECTWFIWVFFLCVCCIFLVVRAEKGALAQIFQCGANTLLWVAQSAGWWPLTFTPWLGGRSYCWPQCLLVCACVCACASQSSDFMTFPPLTCHTHDKCLLRCSSVCSPRGVCTYMCGLQ